MPLSRPPVGAAAIRSRITLPGSLGTCFCVPHRCSQYPQRRGAVPIPGDLLGQQQPCLHQSPPPVSSAPPLSQSFQTASKQGPTVPDGSTVTGIRHRNFVLTQCAESAFITRPNSRSMSRPSKMGVTSLGTMCTAKRSCLVPGSGNQIRVSD